MGTHATPVAMTAASPTVTAKAATAKTCRIKRRHTIVTPKTPTPLRSSSSTCSSQRTQRPPQLQLHPHQSHLLLRLTPRLSRISSTNTTLTWRVFPSQSVCSSHSRDTATSTLPCSSSAQLSPVSYRTPSCRRSHTRLSTTRLWATSTLRPPSSSRSPPCLPFLAG